MINNRFILITNVILCLLVAITGINFSAEHEKQKTFVSQKQEMGNNPVQKKSSTTTATAAAKQLYEKRLQIAQEKFLQMQKQRQVEKTMENSHQAASPATGT